MAIQYWHNRRIKKNKIIAFKNAYHGDTFGAMAVGDRSVFTSAFDKLLFEAVHIDPPANGNESLSADQLNRLVSAGEVGAFIFEPLIQGAGGMLIHSPKGLDALIHMCREHDVITIADEVMTGFGRTGQTFACNYLMNKPDIICLSKGLTGGTMPLGVTSCTKKIYDEFFADDALKTFFHGHSYTANPVACTAALASLDLLESPECQAHIKRIETRHKEFLPHLMGHTMAKKPRSLGTILAVEVVSNEKTGYVNSMRDMLYRYFIENKIIIRPLGNVVYLMPPYCITDEQLQKTYLTIMTLLNKIQK